MEEVDAPSRIEAHISDGACRVDVENADRWIVLEAPMAGKGQGRILANGSFDTRWQVSK